MPNNKNVTGYEIFTKKQKILKVKSNYKKTRYYVLEAAYRITPLLKTTSVFLKNMKKNIP